MKKPHIIILVSILTVSCISFNKRTSQSDAKDSGAVQTYNLPDSLLLGYWGTDSETGNCILWITKDSAFWVDPSIWCSYTLRKDTITMFLEDNYEYLKARYKIENGSLFLTDTFQTVEYKKCGNK